VISVAASCIGRGQRVAIPSGRRAASCLGRDARVDGTLTADLNVDAQLRQHLLR